MAQSVVKVAFATLCSLADAAPQTVAVTTRHSCSATNLQECSATPASQGKLPCGRVPYPSIATFTAGKISVNSGTDSVHFPTQYTCDKGSKCYSAGLLGSCVTRNKGSSWTFANLRWHGCCADGVFNHLAGTSLSMEPGDNLDNMIDKSLPDSLDSSLPGAGTLMLPWKIDMTIQSGFDSVTGTVRSPKCIKNAQVIEDTHTGDLIEFKFKGTTSNEELHRMLDASAGASYNGFGVEASVHAQYVQDQTISEYEAIYVLTAKVDRLSPKYLDPAAEWDETLNGRPDLATLCGDSFIWGHVVGGRLYLTFRTTKESFEKHHSTDMDMSVSGWGAGIEAAMKKSMQYVSSTGKIEVQILQIGGSGADWERHGAPLTVDQVLDRGSTFPGDVDRAPAPFSTVIKTYASFFPKYHPSNPVDVDAAQSAMKELTILFTAAKALESSVIYISVNQDKFAGYSQLKTSCLDPLHQKVIAVINEVKDAFKKLDNDYSASWPAIDMPDASCLPAKDCHYYTSTSWIKNTVESYHICHETCHAQHLVANGEWQYTPGTSKQVSECICCRYIGSEDLVHMYNMSNSMQMLV